MLNIVYTHILYCLVYVLVLGQCYSEDNVVVTLKQGILSGTVEKTLFKQQEYNAFRGIPYAEPPVAALRFLPPKPHQGWEGTYESHKVKPTCMQFSSRRRNDEPFGISGSEDCLYLSVFTPSLRGSAPVVVFDYNDNFRTGFNSTDTYSPDFFVEEDVIVVTINHRLDFLGYLTTNDEVIPPNAGLKDFLLALEWIRDNIKQFGGDPTRVTLMGSRGGAALIHILLVSEKAKGLFSNVIMQSGTALEAIYFSDYARTKAFQLGEEIDIKTESSQVLLEELQKIDTEDLFYKRGNIIVNKDIDERQIPIFPFSPIVEAENPEAVLTSLPDDTNIINDVPILIGLNSREGLDLASHFIFEPKLIQHSVKNLFIHFPIRTGYRFDPNSTVYQKFEEEIREFYLQDGYFHVSNILEYAVYVGDVMHNYALDYTVTKLAEQLSSPLYYYMFDFHGALNENSVFMAKLARGSMKNKGATVGDELCYLHVCTRIRKTYESLVKLVSEQAEIKVLKKMVRMWTNFIKTGNPTPDETDSLLKLKWKPVTKHSKEHEYLHITKSPRMKRGPLGERAAFWNSILEKYAGMAVDGVVSDPAPAHEEL